MIEILRLIKNKIMSIHTLCAEYLAPLNLLLYKSQIYKTIGNRKASKKILIYVFHLSNNLIPRYIIQNAIEFEKRGYTINFVITQSSKSSNFTETINGLSKKLPDSFIFLRKNFGRDFGSLKDVVLSLKTTGELDGIEEVIFQNDSLVGPLFVSNFYDKFIAFKGDMVSITDSYQTQYHLQSSILKFNGSLAINSLGRFFEKYPVYNYRDFVIKFGELAISKFFLKQGLSIKPMINSFESIFYTDHLLKTNPQHSLMEYQILNHDIPFIKREVLSTNPYNIYIEKKEALVKKLGKEGIEMLNEAYHSRIN